MGSLVFKRQCGRCPAIAEMPVTIDEVKKGKIPIDNGQRALRIVLGANTMVEHDFLCDACLEICNKYIKNIGKQLEKRASTRERADEEE